MILYNWFVYMLRVANILISVLNHYMLLLLPTTNITSITYEVILLDRCLLIINIYECLLTGITNNIYI